MIAKGTQHNNGAKLAQYMITGKPGEHAELFELRGFAAADIKDGFRDVQIMAEGTKCEQPFFHVQVRNPTGEEMTRDQWRRVADRIESKLGLSGQPRAIAFHIEDANGHEHMHIAWSRIDENTMTAKHMPFFKDRLKEVSRELEIKFGLTQVSSEREGPIKFGPTRAEEEQARRLGFDKNEVRNFIRDCYDHSDCGVSFQVALEEQGFMLAQGDQRGFVVIDHAGGIHSVSKRILDVSAATIRDHLSDLVRDELPTVENARALAPFYEGDKSQRLNQELAEVNRLVAGEERAQTIIDLAADLAALDELILSHISRPEPLEKPAPVWDREREDSAWQEAVINAAIEKEKADRQFVEPRARETGAGGSRKKELGEQQRQKSAAPDLGKMQGEIRLAYGLTYSAQGFANALEDRGFILARVTPKDIERDRERIKEQAADRKAPQAWMEHEGGYNALTPELQASAKRSYVAWDEEKRRRFSLHDYISYAQDKWREDGQRSILERAKGNPVVVNAYGNVYLLTERNTGDERATLAQYLKDIDRESLLSVTEAQEVMQEYQQHRREEWQHKQAIWEQGRDRAAKRPLNENAADIRLAYSLSQSARGFVENLEERGFKVAHVTEEEADRSHRVAAFAKELGRFAPEFREGEYVAINQRGYIYGLDPRTTGEERADIEKFMGTLNPLHIKGIESVLKKVEAERQAEFEQRREKERILAATGPLKQDVAEIRLAYSLSQSPDGFARNLDECGFRVACATKEEADRSHQNAAFSKAIGRFAPEYREGEYVAINERGHVFSLNMKTTGEGREDVDAFMRTGDHTKIQGIEETRKYIAAHKRPASARELFPNVPDVQGIAIGLPSYAQPLNTWQQFGAAAYEGAHRDTAPDHAKGTSADIWTAFVRSDNARAFVAALQEKNITLALVTRDDVAHSEIDRTYGTNINPAPTPKLREGDYVAITGDARVYNLNRRTTGESAERVQKFMASLDRKDFQGVYATLSAVQERAALHDQQRQAFRDLSAAHIEKPRDTRPTALPGKVLPTNASNFDNILSRPAKVGNSAARTVDKVYDVAVTAFESLFAPTLTPEQIYEGEKSVRRRETEAEQSIDFARHTAELSDQRRQQENQGEAERLRDRERGGRER